MQLVALIIGFTINLATVLMHVTCVGIALPWVQARASLDDAEKRLWRSTPILSLAIGALMVLQLISALVWAVLFYLLRLAPSFSDSVYLALTTISALGGDDAGRTSYWRILLPLASINGALLFGLSTAVMFRLIAFFHLNPPPNR